MSPIRCHASPVTKLARSETGNATTSLACMRFLLLVLILPRLAYAAELLEPEMAFRLSARVSGADALEVRYQIAPGYYMYHDKFRFALEPEAVGAGAPLLPPGKVKRDEFFGEVETYRDEVRIRLPVTVEGSAAIPALELTAVSQGCADVGVCYTPQEQKARLNLAGIDLAAGSPFVTPAALGGGAESLGRRRVRGGVRRARSRDVRSL